MTTDDFPRPDLPDANVSDRVGASRGFPRLRIAHLLLWTFCTAVFLTLERYWLSTGYMPEEYQPVRAVTGLIEAIVNGAALSGTIVLLTARVSDGPPWLRAPGHWLMLARAFGACFIWLPSTILSLIGDVDSDIVQFFDCGVLVISIGVFLLAFKQQQERRWKIFFAALFALTAVKLIANGILLVDVFHFEVFERLHLAYSLGDVVLCPWILAVALIDVKRGVRRDWLHWVGVATFALSQCLYLMWRIGVEFV